MFGRSVKLFKLLGFEVRLDWSWFIIALLVTWSLARGVFPAYIQGLGLGTYWWMGAVGALGLFVSIVLHELGHSVVARGYGIQMRGITLFIFGGVAEMGDEPPSPHSEFFMAIAGPITSVVLGLIFWGFQVLSNVLAWPIEATGIFGYLHWINFALAAFNIIPAFPLDGGRVLRSILWGLKQNLGWATRVAARIGAGFGFLLIAWGVITFIFGNFIAGIWWFVIGLFIRHASQASYQQVVLRQTLAGEPVRRFMNSSPVSVPPQTSLKDFVDNYLYRYNYKMFPVVEDDHLIGCITVNQLKEIPREKWEVLSARDLASPCSRENTITPDADAILALSTMNRAHASRLMVVDHDRLLGVISLKDLLNFLSRKVQFGGA